MAAEKKHVNYSPFMEDVIADTPHGEQLLHCLQCGSCGGSCPNGADMEFTPRTLFAMIAANRRDEVLQSNTMWTCVSCYFCTARCPKEIPITDLMYTLKRMSINAGMAGGSDAPALAKTFTSFVDQYGRSFEFGLASRFYFFHKPSSLLKMGPIGLSMLTRGRLSLRPTKIRQLGQLQAIIKKAKEIGGPL